ncbi:hypothetical protein ABPG75_011575 [Micractinium tetrahymenae]
MMRCGVHPPQLMPESSPAPTNAGLGAKSWQLHCSGLSEATAQILQWRRRSGTGLGELFLREASISRHKSRSIQELCLETLAPLPPAKLTRGRAMRPTAPLLLLLAGLALATALQTPSSATIALSGGAVPSVTQEPGIDVELGSGTVTLKNVRLAAASVAGARLILNADDIAEGDPAGSALSQLAAAAAASGSSSLELDWEQRWEPAPAAGGGGSRGGYSVSAVLPAGVSQQQVRWVAAHCDGCAADGSEVFTGLLGVADVAAPLDGTHAAGSAAVVFLFRGSASTPATTAAVAATTSGGSSSKAATSSAAGALGSRRAGRRLHQLGSPPASLPDCSLAVGSAPAETFAGCKAVTTSPATSYQVYCTLEPGTGANAGGTHWRGGVKVAASAVGGQWAGFGFPQFPGTMIGTHAVIVKECASCPTGATVDGYQLKGYTPPENVAGSFKITETSAAKAADGSLVATFTAELPQPPNQLVASPFDFVYAIGPLASDGNLQAHFGTGLPYGGSKLQLPQPSVVIGGGGNGTASPAPPAGEVAASPPPAAAGSPPPAAAPPPAGETAGAAGGGATNCQLTIDGRQVSFEACVPIQGIGRGYEVMWSLEPAKGSTRDLRLGLRAASAGTWVGFGFPANPGFMLGSTAMILKTCATCPSGASIEDYYLADKVPSAVQPPSKLPVAGASAAANGSVMQGTITVTLDAAAAANPAFPIILAGGHLDSGGGLMYHDNRGASTLNLASGTSSGVQGDSPKVNSMKNAHGWLMAIGWGVLIPLGIVTARHGKRWDPLWFHVHRAVQILGLSCALSGFIIIFIAVKDATGTSVSIYGLHRRLGISAMSLGLCQLTALVFRPHKGTKLRPHWEFGHHWIGRAAAVVAVANIYEGIINVRHVGTWAVATYSVIFGLIAGLHFGLDAIKLALCYWGSSRRCGQEATAPPTAPPAGAAPPASGASAGKLNGGSGSVSADSSNGV